MRSGSDAFSTCARGLQAIVVIASRKDSAARNPTPGPLHRVSLAASDRHTIRGDACIVATRRDVPVPAFLPCGAFRDGVFAARWIACVGDPRSDARVEGRFGCCTVLECFE